MTGFRFRHKLATTVKQADRERELADDHGKNIVAKVWNFCNVLRDDGVQYMQYLEQISNLIFLKIDDEQSKRSQHISDIPKKYNWCSLKQRSGNELKEHYDATLLKLGEKPGLLGLIFKETKNRCKFPATLSRLIELIDSETWSGMDVDIKGEIYEGLLEKNAQETKSGAGQYFTPRPLIDCVVKVIQPKPGETVGEPACGTGGFILGIQKYILKNNRTMNRHQNKILSEDTFYAWDIVSEVIRLCAMNMFIHGIRMDQEHLINADVLANRPTKHFDIVCTNPPFGKKSSNKSITESGKIIRRARVYERDDFWASTSDKQLNFLQHVYLMLKVNGRCAIVLPDSVLSDVNKAAKTIRRKLLQECDVHTLLRLPTGIFYAQQIKTNVLFFDKLPVNPGVPSTKKVWVYDLRTGKTFSQKENPMTSSDLEDFIKCYNVSNRNKRVSSKRFKAYSYNEIMKNEHVKLNLQWLDQTNNSGNLPEPLEIAISIRKNLEESCASIDKVISTLKEPKTP